CGYPSRNGWRRTVTTVLGDAGAVLAIGTRRGPSECSSDHNLATARSERDYHSTSTGAFMKIVLLTYIGLVVFVGAATLSIAPAAKGAPLAPLDRLEIVPLTSPAGSNSAQPQLTTETPGERVTLSWLQRDVKRTTLMFADRTSSGWSEGRAVASGDDFFVNWADVPSVVRLSDNTMAAHWLQQSGPGTYAYDLRLAFSTDDGRTWSAST